MTTATRNEAGPRTSAGRALLASAWQLAPGEPLMLDTILAIEAEAGRAMVQRLGQTLRDADMALKWSRPDRAGLVSLSDIAAILDEEAAR